MKFRLHKILLVDDETIITLQWKRSPELKGICDNILIANSGNEAIEILKKNKDVQLIVTDFMMPNGDGGNLISYVIKNTFNGRGRHIPIILVSGHYPVAKIMKDNLANVLNNILKKDLKLNGILKENSCLKVLSKPIDMKDLVLLIEDMVKNSEIYLLQASLKNLERAFENIRKVLNKKEISR